MEEEEKKKKPLIMKEVLRKRSGFQQRREERRGWCACFVLKEKEKAKKQLFCGWMMNSTVSMRDPPTTPPQIQPNLPN